MESQMIVRIDPSRKSKFQRIARMEGKTASEKIREMIDDYIVTKDFGAAVDRVWDKISTEFRKKGITERDIEAAIREVRSARKK